MALLIGNGLGYKTGIEANKAPLTGSWLRKPGERGPIMNIARSFNNWRKYRQTVAELDRMSARELNDLGISRGQIRDIAKAAFAR